jgi:hypothetical protein
LRCTLTYRSRVGRSVARSLTSPPPLLSLNCRRRLPSTTTAAIHPWPASPPPCLSRPATSSRSPQPRFSPHKSHIPPEVKGRIFALDLRGTATWRWRVKSMRQWSIYIDTPVLWKGGGGGSRGHHEPAKHASGISSWFSSIVGRPPHVRAATAKAEAEELVLASSLNHKEGICLLFLRPWLRDLQK